MSIPYTHINIDRRADLRRTPAELEDLLTSPNALVIPTANDFNLIAQKKDLPSLEKLPFAPNLRANGQNETFLGTIGDHHYFSLDYSHLSNGNLKEFSSKAAFVDLRKVGSELEESEAAMALYARGIQNWHRHHQYCARCGHLTQTTEYGHSRTCLNEECAHVTYPRISPAVIVLVEHRPAEGPPKCLLGKGQRSWGNIRSTLAGFTEIGESLEETVRREMMEEAGIEVHNIRYIGSQPWPFPSSLMVGFFAEATDTNLTLDEEEILEAAWYTVEELKTLEAEGKLVLSRKDSIARYLINTWVAQNS